MNSYFIFKRNTHYLHMKISGFFDYKEFMSIPGIIMTKCEQEKMNKVLVDTLDIDYSSLSTMDKYDLGKELASELAFKIKLAVVVPDQYIDKFMETVAVNRGAHVLVFQSVEAGIDWLIKNL